MTTTATTAAYDPRDLAEIAYWISKELSDRRDDIPALTHIDVGPDDIAPHLPALLDALAARTLERRTAELAARLGEPHTCAHCARSVWLDAENDEWFDARPPWSGGEVCPSDATGATQHQPTV